VNQVWIYDPVSKFWIGAENLIEARQGHTATLLPDGRLLVAGGQSGGIALASAELYDPVTDQWSHARRLNVARAYHTATMLPSGRVFLAAGFNGNYPTNTALYDGAVPATIAKKLREVPMPVVDYGQYCEMLDRARQAGSRIQPST